MNVARWLALAGIILHGTSFLLLEPAAETYAHKVRDKMHSDPEYVPAYEAWETDGVATAIFLGLVCYVYLPTLVLVGVVTTLHSNPIRKIPLFESIGIGLGICTILYALFWIDGIVRFP